MVAALAALLLDCALTILAVLGFLFNIYILVSVALSKQVINANDPPCLSFKKGLFFSAYS